MSGSDRTPKPTIVTATLRRGHRPIVRDDRHAVQPQLTPYVDELIDTYDSRWTQTRSVTYRDPSDPDTRLRAAFTSLDADRRSLKKSEVRRIAKGLPASLRDGDIVTIFATRHGKGIPTAVLDRVAPGPLSGDRPGIVADFHIVGQVLAGELGVYAITKHDDGEVRVFVDPVDIDDRAIGTLARHYGDVIHHRAEDSPYHPRGVEFTDFADTSVLHHRALLDPVVVAEAVVAPGRQFVRDVGDLAERWWHREDKYIDGQPRRVPLDEHSPVPASQVPAGDIYLGALNAYGAEFPGWMTDEEAERYHHECQPTADDLDAWKDYTTWDLSWNPDTGILLAIDNDANSSVSLGRYTGDEIDLAIPPAHRFASVSELDAGNFDQLLDQLDHVPFTVSPNSFSEYTPTQARTPHLDHDVDDGIDM